MSYHPYRSAVTLVVAGAALSTCTFAAVADDAAFLDWSLPVNLGAPVNSSSFADICPSVSKDGRSLYFFSNRPEGLGGNDLWVAQRSESGTWAEPQNLGSTLNTPFQEHSPWLSPDGYELYFTSDRPGGVGGLDVYVARRSNPRDDFGWQPPENLGSRVNTPSNDGAASYFEERESGDLFLYFMSDRPGGLGLDDIYVSKLDWDSGTFGAAALVPDLSSPRADRLPSVRRDGREIFVTSDRTGTLGNLDLWVATRDSTRARNGRHDGRSIWSTPINLGPNINSIEIDGCGRLSRDGTTLYFHSTRLGGFPLFDLYLTTRQPAKVGSDED